MKDLVQIRPEVFKDAADGYVIANIPRIRAEFNGRVQQLNTREMKLETLGVFPLAITSLPLLKQETEYNGKKLTINPLFARSQIPIYSDAEGKYAFIPPEGANICRYFFELWQLPEAETEPGPDEAVIAGFAILASYAGI